MEERSRLESSLKDKDAYIIKLELKLLEMKKQMNDVVYSEKKIITKIKTIKNKSSSKENKKKNSNNRPVTPSSDYYRSSARSEGI